MSSSFGFKSQSVPTDFGNVFVRTHPNRGLEIAAKGEDGYHAMSLLDGMCGNGFHATNRQTAILAAIDDRERKQARVAVYGQMVNAIKH
jgi:hypothetical protein